ncbi:unnamed protein product [Callosobruchus maculatus]|uniref:Uncharacterized protein n=1 Tax=Callosobruchus maculatus TaxID=64391 RepID=A0A653CLJ5_CALMS|nr:unnamed protein product [Callosobruchus maculatus]
MRFKTETLEVERRGDGVDEPDVFDSLSARARRRAANRQPHRYRGIENGVSSSPLDRKDALTRRPLDFDQEEETRKVETSKWLEHHFGSDSKSSNNSIIDDDEERAPPKTSFFNVTIKSQPSVEAVPQNTYSARVYSPVEAERERDHPGVFYKGITEWSERRHDNRYASDRISPSPSPYRHHPHYASDHHPPPRHSPSPDYRYSPPSPHHSPIPDYRGVRHSPSPDYRQHSPTPDYGRSISPRKEVIAPTPPQRKKSERHRQKAVEERSRYDSGYRSSRTEDYRDLRDQRMERLEEPPPDYSPPSPPPMPVDKKQTQKTRFAVDTTPTKPHKSGNIIGQSIRKLVGKIRSASAERKARQQRAKRSPSPSYQPGHVIDSNIGNNGSSNGHDRPVQRYYLGEDPFAGSIYGRENKYDGVVRPTRSSKRQTNGSAPGDERRSQSTLGRFSKSTGRLVNGSVVDNRSSQTLPRHLHKQSDSPSKLGTRSNSTINISIINTPRKLEGPAKPARTYKSSLSRSKSFNVQAGLESQRNNMYTSNPHLNKLEDSGIGLKSPGLISSLNRSHKDINGDDIYTSRFARNGTSDYIDSKRGFQTSFREKTPEYWKPGTYSTPVRNGTGYSNGNIYEPPTRLRDSMSPSQSIVRRGSSSSTDFSETYHTTTRNDDPVRPSVTDTTKSFSKKIIPSKDGKSIETIQSSELKSVTKSHYRGSTPTRTLYEERRYNTGTTNPVVIEVRNYRK